ncbi:MAG: DUF3634 family protein [Polyangiaceae bacterium]|jgi:hypothetical protein
MAVLVACAIGVAIGLMLVWANARAAITIAVAEIDDGKLTVTRGGLSPRVLEDLRDVISRPRVKHAIVRIVRAKDRARLEVEGEVGEQQLQRLRNIVGNVPVAQLARTGRP